MNEPAIEKPWIAVAVLRTLVRRANREGNDNVLMPIEAAEKILAYYEQAERAGRSITDSTIFVARANERKC